MCSGPALGLVVGLVIVNEILYMAGWRDSRRFGESSGGFLNQFSCFWHWIAWRHQKRRTRIQQIQVWSVCAAWPFSRFSWPVSSLLSVCSASQFVTSMTRNLSAYSPLNREYDHDGLCQLVEAHDYDRGTSDLVETRGMGLMPTQTGLR